MVRIRSKIEELYTLDFPNSRTPAQPKKLLRHNKHKTTHRHLRTKTTRCNAVGSDAMAKLVSGITDLRDKALVLLLIDTGLRTGEVTELDRDSIEIPACLNPVA